jgi:hypothetical protein
MLLAMIAQIAAAIAWVAFYSYLIHPGETPAFYERYAQVASPWVSVVVGFPIFYLLCRWIGSRVGAAAAWPTAMAVFGLYVGADLAIVLSVGDITPRLAGMLAASYFLKFLASHLAGRSAARSGRANHAVG